MKIQEGDLVLEEMNFRSFFSLILITKIVGYYAEGYILDCASENELGIYESEGVDEITKVPEDLYDIIDLRDCILIEKNTDNK